MIGRALMLLAGVSMVAFPMWGEPALAADFPMDYLIIPGTALFGDHPFAAEWLYGILKCYGCDPWFLPKL